MIQNCVKPIQRLGCYIPGGEASYPSSLIMSVTPAKVSGVPQITVCSPPRFRNEIHPLILVSADICGIKEIYRIGGVQAIAAMTYGTKKIQQVDKLVGPGNKYVLTAKMLVSHHIPTDFPAGSSEIVVLADDSAEARMVALDMISQAEHKDGIAILVTTSKSLVDNVSEYISKLIPSLPNKETISNNLARNGYIIILKDIEETISFVNKFAPEHLEIMVSDEDAVVKQINAAGLVLLGKYTPVSASDYSLGSVHVLPTGGFSHVYSGLSVFDFIKRFCVVKCSKDELLNLETDIQVLARAEGLLNHALSVQGRFKHG
jgi:histidinol dehydrogenase